MIEPTSNRRSNTDAVNRLVWAINSKRNSKAKLFINYACQWSTNYSCSVFSQVLLQNEQKFAGLSISLKNLVTKLGRSCIKAVSEMRKIETKNNSVWLRASDNKKILNSDFGMSRKAIIYSSLDLGFVM